MADKWLSGTLRPTSFLQAEVVLNRAEGVEGELEVLARVGGGDLGADAGLAFGDDGKTEADDVNAEGEHGVGEFGGEGSIADHDGADGMGAREDVEAELGHAFAEEF